MNKCICGKREQNKCCVESDTKTWKMCLKEDMTLSDHEKRLLSDPDYQSLWFEQMTNLNKSITITDVKKFQWCAKIALYLQDYDWSLEEAYTLAENLHFSYVVEPEDYEKLIRLKL